MSPDLVGWTASALLIATLARQIHTQAQQDDAHGVSRWLFIGQMASSVGFVVYSWLLHNWVFITTNSLILLTAMIGQVVLWRKRHARSRPGHT